jgi:peptide/nickel transport system ATP-binding protein
MQMIFQDPNASLNPLRRVNNIVLEGLRFSRGRGKRDRARADAVLRAVGLDPDVVGSRRPHEFSGGQCQRICIARALVLEPRLLICDEPVSALDVSVQAQILNLLEDMKLRYGLTMLFISHDMAVVRNISDRIMVMYLGKVCEVASTEVLFERPAHPYTAALLASIPRPHPPAEEDEPMLSGEPPSPVDPPSGCRFRTRCPKAQPRCASEEPEMQPVGSGHFAACHYPNVV